MRKQFITFMLLFLITLPVSAIAEMAIVPKSGQTLCYDQAGAVITCAGTGQDGDQPMGAEWPIPRFTDNNNGTITDHLTGLVWLKNANCLSSQSSWAYALSAADTLASGACGLTDGSAAGDWRLPNRKELKSLVNRQQLNMATWLNGSGFTNVKSSCYWSSSTIASNTESAWVVYMTGGYEYDSIKSGGNGYVWPVRSGQ
jgi:hypothetical protein